MAIPKLVAHRGYMRHYPENTLSAIQAALDAGAAYIEFDVQMNADYEFIVIHDKNFKRTTGVKKLVFNATSEQCRKFSVHEPKRYDNQFYPEPVPFLTEALDLIASYPETTAIVEIKKQSLHHWGYAFVMDKLIAQLEAYPKDCMLISFDDNAIEYAQQKSDLTTGWVLYEYDDEHYQRAKELQPDFLMCNYKKIPEGEAPWSDFKRWMLYDLMDPECIMRYSNMGVELIETGDVSQMMQELVLQELPIAERLKKSGARFSGFIG